MERMRSVKIAGTEGQMELAFSEIVLLRMITEPGQLQFKIAHFILQEGDDEGTVLSGLASGFLEAKSLAVKSDRCIKIADIVVLMDHSKVHRTTPFFYHRTESYIDSIPQPWWFTNTIKYDIFVFAEFKLVRREKYCSVILS